MITSTLIFNIYLVVPKIEIQRGDVRQYFDIQIGSFDNRNEIKWNIPISFFFVLNKRSGMPVNKGIKS